MKSIYTLIFLTFLTSNKTTAQNIILDENKYSQKTITKLTLFTNTIKDHFKFSNTTLINKKTTKNKTTFDISWSTNKENISRRLTNYLTLFNGLKPKTTNSTYKTMNNIYFYNKPLGEKYGLTYENKDKELFDILKDLKVFIVAKHNGTEILTPILSTNSKEGCDLDVFNNNNEILCIQTSNSINGNESIGSLQGFSNTITFPGTINDASEVTLTTKMYYKSHEI